ncbi:MAG: type II secretion system protein [Planctomycetes bacterium]|nr:type II secretion system protein [Planctomycetota bacterium]
MVQLSNGNGRGARRRAFTLIEVLVSVAIVALLMAVLLPSLTRAHRAANAASCLSNLRQMAMAAQGYVVAYGRYMPYSFSDPAKSTVYNWDLTLVTLPAAGSMTTVKAGLLWQGRMLAQINQCPAYEGGDNFIGYPYSGYNYNTSHVGWCVYRPERDEKYKLTGRIVAVEEPARAEHIRHPAECALFGDGEYGGGANKYMRSPFAGRDRGVFTGRSAGTQGYRHAHKTNVAFTDGHAVSWVLRYTETEDPEDAKNITPATGFISRDNGLYDLE